MTPAIIAARLAAEVRDHLPSRASVRCSVCGDGHSIGVILDGHAISLFVSAGQRFDGRQAANNAMASILRDLAREAYVMATNGKLFGADETEFALLAGARLALELAGTADGEEERVSLLVAIDSYIGVPNADGEPDELLLTEVVSEPGGLAAIRDAALDDDRQDQAA